MAGGLQNKFVKLFGLTVLYPWLLLATFLSVFEQGTIIYKCIVRCVFSMCFLCIQYQEIMQILLVWW